MTKKHKHLGCPSWLNLTADRTAFVFNPERAEIVKEIFKMRQALEDIPLQKN